MLYMTLLIKPLTIIFINLLGITEHCLLSHGFPQIHKNQVPVGCLPALRRSRIFLHREKFGSEHLSASLAKPQSLTGALLHICAQTLCQGLPRTENSSWVLEQITPGPWTPSFSPGHSGLTRSLKPGVWEIRCHSNMTGTQASLATGHLGFREASRWKKKLGGHP